MFTPLDRKSQKATALAMRETVRTQSHPDALWKSMFHLISTDCVQMFSKSATSQSEHTAGIFFKSTAVHEERLRRNYKKRKINRTTGQPSGGGGSPGTSPSLCAQLELRDGEQHSPLLSQTLTQPGEFSSSVLGGGINSSADSRVAVGLIEPGYRGALSVSRENISVKTNEGRPGQTPPQASACPGTRGPARTSRAVHTLASRLGSNPLCSRV